MEELQVIQSKIYEIRGLKVMLDRDLAELQVQKKLDDKPRNPIGFVTPKKKE